MFDAVQQIETEDALARTKRRATSGQTQAASRAAVSQQAIYGKLVELRILLQRGLPTNNGIMENDKKRQESIDECNTLLSLLLSAQDQLSNHEKTTSVKQYESMVQDEERLEETLEQNFAREKALWEEVLNRRHKEVRLHAGLTAKSQFRVLDSSFWQQVESTVRHEKLQHRQNNTNTSGGDGATAINPTGNDDAFDDSKVYHQLLKEFVSTHPAQEGDRRAQERLRAAGTRRTVHQVDRRASKGRKLRYTPITKLAHFTFPLSRPAANLDDDAWFRSLFGGTAAVVAAKKTA